MNYVVLLRKFNKKINNGGEPRGDGSPPVEIDHKEGEEKAQKGTLKITNII